MFITPCYYTPRANILKHFFNGNNQIIKLLLSGLMYKSLNIRVELSLPYKVFFLEKCILGCY